MQKTLVIGAGQVGQGLAKVLAKKYEVETYDYEETDKWLEITKNTYQVIHICFPYSDKFCVQVEAYLSLLNPKLCIIHSTVSPDCEVVHMKGVVYSPVRGVHPNLAEGIQTFQKVIASDDPEALKLADAHLTACGIQTRAYTVKEAIYAKLLSTTYYGVCIAFADYVKKICDEECLDYHRVYENWNKSYNYGYRQLGKHNVARPVLTPPEGVIGGHCIASNAKLLAESHDSPFLDMIQDLKNVKK